MARRAALALVAFLAAGPAAADGLHVSVEHVGDDPTGERLAYAVKEKFRGSTAFHIPIGNENSAYQVRIATMAFESEPLTIFAATLTMQDFSQGRLSNGPFVYIYSMPGYCGREAVATCADSIFARMGRQIEDIGNALAKHYDAPEASK